MMVLASEPLVDHAVLKILDEEGFPDTADQGAGEILFSTPTLLGGQAAKAGLSCSSCHINGRDNPHFFLTGVSGEQGTADVTHSFFSALRGNGHFDPLPIPDLAQPGKISRDEAKGELEPFIRNLIVEEFGGAEPSPAILHALGSYVRALRVPGPHRQGQFRRQYSDQTRLIALGTSASLAMIDKHDRQGALLAIAGIRHQLELLHERYAGPKLKAERQMLVGASRRLGQIAQTKNLDEMAKAIVKWDHDFHRIETMLRRKSSQSLYDPDQLEQALGMQAEYYPIP